MTAAESKRSSVSAQQNRGFDRTCGLVVPRRRRRRFGGRPLARNCSTSRPYSVPPRHETVLDSALALLRPAALLAARLSAQRATVSVLVFV